MPTLYQYPHQVLKATGAPVNTNMCTWRYMKLCEFFSNFPMGFIEHHLQNGNVQMSCWPWSLLFWNEVWPVWACVTHWFIVFCSKTSVQQTSQFVWQAEYSIICSCQLSQSQPVSAPPIQNGTTKPGNHETHIQQFRSRSKQYVKRTE